MICRLNISETEIFSPVLDRDMEMNEDLILNEPSLATAVPSCSTSVPSCSTSDSSSTSGTSPSHVVELQNLVHDLLGQQDNSNSFVNFDTLADTLKFLKEAMSSEVEKLKVDEDDILSDALAYFKSPSYDPKVPIKIKFTGQPAVDTGGLRRQFFTSLYEQLIKGGEGIPPLFEGDESKLPIYNTSVAVSGVMTIVGMMFAHSIVQLGIGPAFFPEAIFKYFCTSDFSTTTCCINVADVTCRTKYLIDQVRFLELQ